MTVVTSSQLWAFGEKRVETMISSDGQPTEGYGEGMTVGPDVGTLLGDGDGTALGAPDGFALGDAVGAVDGADDGAPLGSELGAAEGVVVGCADG